MGRSRLLAGLALLVASVAVAVTGASPLGAQDGTIAASVNVLLPPATGVGMRGLDFGMVTPGVPTEVQPTDATSGWFRLAHIPRPKSVQLQFTFPSNLTRTGGGTMPISFSGGFARSCGTVCQDHTLSPIPISATESRATITHVRPPPPNS